LIVEIETDRAVQPFLQALQSEAPRAARIARCDVEELAPAAGYRDFQILASPARDRRFTLISADLATCPECIAEIRDPTARRFAYPFTNCTNCGPRYSITVSTPYDRANTTMRPFPLCAACAREYADPADRRFHAEPIACPACGPVLSVDLAVITAALTAGAIVALKALGGFQLACDAFATAAVEALRTRKRRSRKPFALMLRDLAAVRRYCAVSPAEEEALCSAAAPIVLLSLRNPSSFPGIAPGLREVGVMLPCTPLHHLLFSDALTCLVMTSGNRSEEPIVIHNHEARHTLGPLADLVVTHNRDIFMRVDDSIQRIFEDRPRTLRRARGFAPEAIPLACESAEVLACGAELKSSFCLTKGRFAILSQHIGDLENFETLQFFEETLRNLQSVYQAAPRLIAHDLHPDYLSSRWALARPEPKLAVQHHHAHIASCMAENGLAGPVIGVAFDGSGFGPDGHIWGGEFLVCDFTGFTRAAHLRYVPLPGGDRAAREPWRMAASYLFDALGPDYRSFDLPCWQAAPSSTWKLLDRIIVRMIARPTLLTSSCGRLFDAVAAITGISDVNTFEGESAMLLEAAASTDDTDHYKITLEPSGIVDPRAMLAQIAREIASGASPARVAARFHNSVAHVINLVCGQVRERNGLDKVCLSGGVFQNFTLLTRSVDRLRRSGFQVYLHSQVPPNDGGISLGQAVIAAHSLSQDNPHVPRHSR
jgi:hydrogenase maturation protein HypF